MGYRSYDHLKAVVTSLRYKGTLYDPEYFYFKMIQEDYEANSNLLRPEIEKDQKRLEEERKKIDPKEVEKKLEAYEKKCQNKPTRLALIKEIKQLLYITTPKNEEAIKSLSFQFNEVIRRARMADIDTEIIGLLRRKQQPLAKIISERHL
jgi:uncharacterized protein YxeA